MGQSEQEFLEQLRATFKIEAEEHLQAITSGLAGLKKSPPPSDPKTVLEVMHRAAHSLKGAARAVDLNDVEAVCQSLESFLLPLKQGETKLAGKHLETVHQTLDTIGRLLSPADRSGEDSSNDASGQFVPVGESETRGERDGTEQVLGGSEGPI